MLDWNGISKYKSDSIRRIKTKSQNRFRRRETDGLPTDFRSDAATLNVQVIEILIDHNNLKEFMKVKMFNERQIKWILKLAVLDFVIKHRPKKNNPADASFQRFDYQNINEKMQNLLSILQQKLSKIELINICTSKM